VPQGTVTPEILAAAMSQMQVDITAATRETILAYLLDWSFQDPDGRPLVIADQPRSVVSAILSNIDDDAYMEVLRAIGAHKAAVDAEVAAQKKIPRGPRPLTPISTSVG
jgi:hypothetical protein